MTLFLVVLAVFVAWVIIPIYVSMRSPVNFVNPALMIDNDANRDPRDNANKFRASLNTKDRPDTYDLSTKSAIYDKLVCLCGAASVAEGCTFKDGVYSDSDLTFEYGCEVDRVACDHGLKFDRETHVVKWADSKGELIVGRNSRLGNCISSETSIALDIGCEFKKLYAPVIKIGFGRYLQAKIPDIPVNGEVIRDPGRFDDKSIIHGTIISQGIVDVGSDSVVEGSIKAMGDVHIGSGTVISGNVISEGNMHLDNRVTVCGNIFSQGNVILGQGVRVGMPGKIKSCIARRELTLTKGCLIYGFAEGLGGGKTISTEAYKIQNI